MENPVQVKPFETPLCEIAFKYQTDKCPQVNHPYTPFYYRLLKDKKIKTVLELGIGGGHYLDKLRHHGFHPTPGGSLRMWRDFLGAKVYGIDYDPACMFEDRDIKTFQAHATRKEELQNVLDQIPEVDLFIDDGSHAIHHQIKTAQILLPLFKKDVIYVIEDVGNPAAVLKGLEEYDAYIPPMPPKKGDCIIVVKNK